MTTQTIEEALIAYMERVKELEEALGRAADALANDDLSQSERIYEAGLARETAKAR